MLVGPQAIFIQARADPKKQWLTTKCKLNDAELDGIVEEWPEQWKVPVGEDQLSDPEEGPLTDVPKDQDETKESKGEEKSSDGASLTTPTELELDKQQEEARTKRKFEQGEGSRTSRLPNEQMNKLLGKIPMWKMRTM